MTVRDDLYVWLSQQPAWQQDLAKRLTGAVTLTPEQRSEALAVVVEAHGAALAGAPAVETLTLALDDLPADALPGAPRLVGLGPMHGVGAVAEEQQMRFSATGITVVYGQNAAGKSTYVRALKRICRAVDRQQAIRGNVFADGAPIPPTAVVEVQIGGQPRAQRVDLAAPADLGLDSLSVFDSQCSETYLDHHNAIAYVPPSVRLLTRMATLQESLRADLSEQASLLRQGVPTFAEFTTACPAKDLVDGLSAATDLAALEGRATLTAEETHRITELQVAVAPSDAPLAQAAAPASRADAEQARELARSLRQLEARVTQATVDDLATSARRAATAQSAVDAVASEFAGLPVSRAGSDPWRAMWNAARAFAEAAESPFPPAAGAHCPLCMQQIDAGAATRLSHFEAHIRSAVGQENEEAQTALAAALQSVQETHATSCRTPFLAGLEQRNEQLHRRATAFIDRVRGRMHLLREDPVEARVVAPLDDVPAAVDAWAEERDRYAATLEAAGDPTQQAALREELAGLEGRQKLVARLGDVQACVGALRRAAALDTARSALATNRLTSKQRSLSESIVTGTLTQKLEEEIAGLNCTHLPVALNPQTSVGETEVALRLADAAGTPALADIASEGEQRALSLAFFFAEIASCDHDGGLIVDDPVSSLDDERRDRIACRLVELAADRQVIVFTHDLPFMLDLTDRAKDASVDLQARGVWRMGDRVGRVDDEPPFKAMKLKPRIAKLSTRVQEWDAQDDPRDFDEAWRRVCDFYSDMRVTWERAVEERLFRGVVQRFQREVKTLALGGINITPELVAQVDAGMTRCSQFVHDAPPAASVALPGRTQIAADLELLSDFERATKT